MGNPFSQYKENRVISVFLDVIHRQFSQCIMIVFNIIQTKTNRTKQRVAMSLNMTLYKPHWCKYSSCWITCLWCSSTFWSSIVWVLNIYFKMFSVDWSPNIFYVSNRRNLKQWWELNPRLRLSIKLPVLMLVCCSKMFYYVRKLQRMLWTVLLYHYEWSYTITSIQ